MLKTDPRSMSTRQN